MSNRNEIFGRLLKGAINSVATYEGKTAVNYRRELAAKVNLAGSAIQRYKAGYLPPEARTIETSPRLLYGVASSPANGSSASCTPLVITRPPNSWTASARLALPAHVRHGSTRTSRLQPIASLSHARKCLQRFWTA